MILRLPKFLACLLAGLISVSTNLSAVNATEVDSPKSDDATGTAKHETDELSQLVDDAISITARRYLTADVHTPWQIMHGLLALREDFLIKVDNQKVSALEWLTEGQTYNDLPIVEHSPYGGRFHTFTEPYAFEGHPNQFLAILTMSELPADYTFKTNVNGQVSIKEMLRNAQMEVNDREEITWTLWALSRYLPIDSEWNNKFGDPWSIERLVQIQTYAEPNDAACGGTHGLFALSLARNAYLATGQQPRGIWFEADQKIRRYIASARSLQNSDGSLSSKYFGGPGYSPEFGKRLATGGHVLEFLMVGARDEDLQQEWLRNAVRSVARDLVDHRRAAADCGPLYHALHALVLYRQRTGMATAAPDEETPQPESLADATPTPEAVPNAPFDDNSTTTDTAEPTAESESDGGSEPEQVFVAVSEPESTVATTPEVKDVAVTDAESDREAPMPDPAAALRKPESDDDTPRGLFDAVDVESSEDASKEEVSEVEQAQSADDGSSDDDAKETLQEQEVEEDVRTPEDNAPEVRDEPQIMEDGYEVPSPPTMD